MIDIMLKASSERITANATPSAGTMSLRSSVGETVVASYENIAANRM